MSKTDPNSNDNPSANDSATSSRGWFIQLMIVMALVGILFLLLFPAVRQARHAARMSQSRDNLRSIGVALQNYSSVGGVLPPGGIFDRNDKGYIGWQVPIMPYMDASPLYNRVNSHITWDEPPNSESFLAQGACPTWRSLLAADAADSRGFGLTHYSANSHLFYKNSSTKFDDITDGLGTTIMVGEIAAGFPPYAAPGNWRDPALGIHYDERTFGRPTRDGVSFLMADGAVRMVSDKIALEVLQALATPAGGEQVDLRNLPER